MDAALVEMRELLQKLFPEISLPSSLVRPSPVLLVLIPLGRPALSDGARCWYTERSHIQSPGSPVKGSRVEGAVRANIA